MYTIEKEFHFSASHQLLYLGKDHPCARVHGHNYVVILQLQSETLDKNGFVREYNDLNELRDYIDEKFDHRHINDVLGNDTVTSELLAKHFFDWAYARWPEVTAVRIHETPKTMSEYRKS